VQGDGMAFRVPLAGTVPWLACGVIVWLLTGLTRDEWLGFGVCLIVASLAYVGTRRTNDRVPEVQGADID
jgi:hypothetical protein